MKNRQGFWARCAIAHVAFVAFGACGGIASAADHVVILTISTYARAPLIGTAHDARNAIQLAEGLGYAKDNVTILKDQRLNASGMRAILAQLDERVKTNDRLFFYYSGHGTNILVNNQCVSSLVTHDESYITLDELKIHFDRLKGKARDVVIVLDACFSGGMQALAVPHTRSSGGSAALHQGLAAKAWTPKPGDVCDEPTNVSKAWQVPQAGARGLSRVPENNFTFVAAASERQVALDDPTRGGLATVSLLQCINDGVPSVGLATASQLATCAQELIDAKVPEINARFGTRWTAQTLQVAGNARRPLDALMTKPLTQSGLQSKQTDQVTSALKEIATSGANGNWAFQVLPTRSAVQLAEPAQRRIVRFPYTSSQPGYGYVLYVGTDGKDMRQLFPEPGESNFLAARGEFPPLSIDPPAGENTYLFVLSETPMNFAGIFKDRNTEVDTTIAIQCELTNRNSNRVKVGNVCDRQRNSARIRPEATPVGTLEGYAAQMVTISGW